LPLTGPCLSLFICSCGSRPQWKCEPGNRYYKIRAQRNATQCANVYNWRMKYTREAYACKPTIQNATKTREEELGTKQTFIYQSNFVKLKLLFKRPNSSDENHLAWWKNHSRVWGEEPASPVQNVLAQEIYQVRSSQLWIIFMNASTRIFMIRFVSIYIYIWKTHENWNFPKAQFKFLFAYYDFQEQLAH
jgi:hypothetical protein